MSRPRSYRARGIVLKRMDFGEADRILTLYTRELGKLRAIAKGVRRTRSRSAGHLEPFTETEMLFAVGRELDVVVEATTVQAFRGVRENLENASYAYYMTECVDALTEDRQESAAVFHALVSGFTQLEGGSDGRVAVLEFLVRLLQALGYRPEITECVVCRAALQPGKNQFSGFLGGALCPDCGPRDPSARPLSTDALKLLRYLQRKPNENLVSVPPAVSREAEYILREYAEQIIERRLKTPAFIARVQGVVQAPSV